MKTATGSKQKLYYIKNNLFTNLKTLIYEKQKLPLMPKKRKPRQRFPKKHLKTFLNSKNFQRYEKKQIIQ
jgi:hypothetical protein